MRLKVIGWLFWPSSLSRNAGSAGSSSRHPDPSNVYASTCVIRHDERLIYTHLSDRYAPFHTKVIAATASEALHVLDGLLYHQSDVKQ